jgi:formyltetrahydrofolate deformylase
MPATPPSVVLTLSCPDRIGIVQAVSGFLAERGCNISDSAQFREPKTDRFFMRVAFSSATEAGRLCPDFSAIATRFGMAWQMSDCSATPRILIMVSRFGHCLNDLLFRFGNGALHAQIVAIVSNHRDFEGLAASYGVPFHYLPVTPETKRQQERRLIDIVGEDSIDLVVLARYMQVLSDEACRALEGRAINIHHSFLPSFKGAKPYHQAHERGVKLIGATAHYVTADLDEGPIIEQEVARVDHAADANAIVAIGRDIESIVLARAVQLHVQRRILLNGRRTIIFR